MNESHKRISFKDPNVKTTNHKPKEMSLEINAASERIKIGLLGDWWLLLYSEMLKKLFQLKFGAFS